MAPTPCEFILSSQAKLSKSFYTGAGYATDIYGQAVATSLTSELEGDKMVLKICKPPRDKDSMVALTWQCCTWVVAVSFPAFFQVKMLYLASCGKFSPPFFTWQC